MIDTYSTRHSTSLDVSSTADTNALADAAHFSQLALSVCTCGHATATPSLAISALCVHVSDVTVHALATLADGWMLYTYQRPCTGMCRLTACCCFRCMSKCGGHPRATGDTCLCNQVRVQPCLALFLLCAEWLAAGVALLQTAFLRQSGLRDVDLLYANWANDSVCTVAYSVTVDHSRQAVVITCRGTLSVNDAITDAMAGTVEGAQRRCCG